MAFQWTKEADDKLLAWGALMAPVDFASLASEIGGGCTAKLAKKRMYWLLLEKAFYKEVEALGIDLSNAGPDRIDRGLFAFETEFGDKIWANPCFVGYCFSTDDE